MSVLLIDAGNTRYEWRLLHEEILEGVASYSEPLIKKIDGVDRVFVASVSANEQFKSHLNKLYGDSVEWIESPKANYARFVHCYKHPARLGVDRWLAMIGARKYTNAKAMVVDAGTALTIDLINNENAHLGGYIVPGLVMAEQVLFRDASKVNLYIDEQKKGSLNLGQETVSCVVNGLLKQRLSFVRMIQQDYDDFEVMITGGDGFSLAEQLQVKYYRNLVLDGMEILCAGYL